MSGSDSMAGAPGRATRRAAPDVATPRAGTAWGEGGAGYTDSSGRPPDPAILARAEALARNLNLTPRDVLLAAGWIGARAHGVPSDDRLPLPNGTYRPRPSAPAPGFADAAAGGLPQASDSVRQTVLRTLAGRLTDNAIHGLARRFPGESAGEGLTAAQRHTLVAVFAAASICFYLSPIHTLNVLAGVATLFFGLVVALRVVACINMAVSLPLRWLRGNDAPANEAELPVYSVLVPLYREAQVLEGLVKALARIDYPPARLQILLILESVDPETINRARALSLPDHFRLVVVPDGGPRTKPKALNYALPLARGDYVVVYDAEDRPNPDQLRKALAAFASGPPNLACVQARLTLYNGAESWLTKQFAIEYGALFRGILPTLERLGLPIPLGGTSNHFRASALRWLGCWDAWNVTEDADLGMRLYRHGYICRMLDSETAEEAPCGLRAWLGQRTRWLKGWMQTWSVHMRRPVKLWRQFGTGRFIGFHVMVGGMIFSALAHPLLYVLLVLEASAETPFLLPVNLFGIHVWLMALFNIAIGFVASMGLSLIALRQTGARFALHILFMPVYWLLISFAAYRALGQLLTRPFHWEKTEHGVSHMARRR